MKLDERCKTIELILSDVDGVLTDGGIVYDNQGIEAKRFHIRDGMGIRLWQRAGFRFGVLTARSSHIVKIRMAELGVEIIRQGFESKWPTALAVIQDLGLRPDQVCFIGDDLPDLPVMSSVGLAIAVADAAADVVSAAHLVTKAAGGSGAVREAIETILRAKGKWADLVRMYATS